VIAAVICGPGPPFGEPEPQPAAAADQAARDGEDAQAEPFRFPAAGLAGQGEHLRPGGELAGQGHELAPEITLC
jgi:hypothetical protein